MTRFFTFLGSVTFFYIFLGLFGLGALWIAATSLYPMAFDEEFHYGLIQIYATSLLPYGIDHTSDMAQFGSATADASYLFHYLMSFPYRILAFFGVPDIALIIILRIMNIAFVGAALIVFRRALLRAGFSGATTNVSLLLVTLIPIFPLLAAHINYDNLLLLVFAWCVLSIVGITSDVRAGKPFPLSQTFQLAIGVLIGMSIKYAFLPLALGLFIWLVWLLVIGYRNHKQTVTSQLRSFRSKWKALIPKKRYVLIAASILSLFFASHYLTNLLTYGSPIPSCERVFSENECKAYGPWNRNKNMEARKSESFQPMSYPAYMQTEWFPGMTQRLAFAVAGKTNNFDTRLPLPAVVYTLVTFSVLGLIAFVIQVIRRRNTWFGVFTLLLAVLYSLVLSLQLYGDYVDTAEPVAINGRYLLPLLPLVGAVLIQSLRSLIPLKSTTLSLIATAVVVLLIVSGGGIATYVIQAGSHWFWPGFGRESHLILQQIVERVVLPYRY